MNKIDVTNKLATTEASLKRWQTRLKRAATKVNELDRARRRYQLMLLNPDQPVIATVRVKKPPTKKVTAFEVLTGLPPETVVVDQRPSPPPGSLAEKYRGQEQALIEASKEVSFDIPAFLDRADPHVAEKLTAARKKAEAEERKKMPLTGKAALAKIRERK